MLSQRRKTIAEENKIVKLANTGTSCILHLNFNYFITKLTFK